MEQTQNIQFTPEQLNIVLLGLQKLPWEISNALIGEIMKQVQPVPKNEPKKKD